MSRVLANVVVAFVVVVLGAAAVAQAAPKRPRSYALREFLVEGNPTDKERQVLDDAVQKQVELTVSSFGVNIERERLGKLFAERPHLKDCREKNCLVEIGDYLQADRLLSVVIERTGAPGDRGEWEVRLTLFAVDALKYSDRQSMPCRNCTVDEVLRDFANLLEPSVKNEKSTPLCTIAVATTPPGGSVLLDGEAVGLAPFEHTIEAGRRTIGARAADAPKNELEIECPARGTQKVTFKLDSHGEPPLVTSGPAASAIGGTPKSVVWKGIGGAMIGVGVLGFAGAGVAGYYNGKGNCGSGNCPRLYDTRGAIAGLTVSGVVLVAAGIGLVVKGILDDKRPRTTWLLAPSVASGTVTLDAFGRF